MWHFGKGQALRLGRPSIFITSPLVIWNLASPIFVSPASLAVPVTLAHVLIPSFVLPLVPLSSQISLPDFLLQLFWVNVVEILTAGNKEIPFSARTEACGCVCVCAGWGGGGGVQGLHVNSSCGDGGGREKG